MSETTQTAITEKKIVKARKPKLNKASELEDFKSWVSSLEGVIVPIVHINGKDHSSTSILTVDFGTPLNETNKLTNEQNADLVSRMKSLTRSMFKNDVSVRVQQDQSNGIYWSSI